MQRAVPSYRDRTSEQIIQDKVYFDSAGYAFRALSWLDIAKKRGNVCCLFYAALEVRHAIEELLFEQLVIGVDKGLKREDYERCRGNATKLSKFVKKLIPDYELLTQFTEALCAVVPDAPRVITWDHNRLMRLWGETSKYLHWSGSPADTTSSSNWLQEGIRVVEEAGLYIWDTHVSGLHGAMKPSDMEPEIRSLWER